MTDKNFIDNSGKNAYPDIHWRGLVEDDAVHTLYGFHGAFPFHTYADYAWDSDFTVECPLCGNKLLCNDYDGRREPPHATFWTKNFCDECGVRVIVPTNDEPYSFCDENFLDDCTEHEGWSLFYDPKNKEFHLMANDYCAQAVLDDWDLVKGTE